MGDVNNSEEDVQLLNEAIQYIEVAISKVNEISRKEMGLQKVESKLTDVCNSLTQVKVVLNTKAKCYAMADNPLDVNISDCGFGVSVYSNLKRAGICTLGDIMDRGIDGLLRIRNVGYLTVQKISDVCKIYGLELV